MAHVHAHAHDHAGAADGRALAITLALVVLVLVAELVGAWLSGSLALLSDAAHMFTDAAALAISLLALRLAGRPADRRLSFGYARVEILAAMVNALMLLAAAAYIVYEAWRRLQQPPQIESTTMLVVAVAGLVVNLVGMRLLQAGQSRNLNVKGAYLEVWSDMLGSVGVIVGALVIRFTGWTWVDTAVAVGIGLWVLPRTWKLLRESGGVLLEAVPAHLDLDEVMQALRTQPGVRDVHDLHIWAIASGRASLSVHVVLAPQAAADDALLGRLRGMLADRFGLAHSTVQMEHRPCEQAGARHVFEGRGQAGAAHAAH
ncbi:MAG: cation transporter [Rhizobacter sp.]|nr:cation transporter [Rhizobacter sp.]